MPEAKDLARGDGETLPKGSRTAAKAKGYAEVGIKDGNVVVYFGEIDHHVVFTPAEARAFAHLILKKQDEALHPDGVPC